jgi:hypothetical protein
VIKLKTVDDLPSKSTVSSVPASVAYNPSSLFGVQSIELYAGLGLLVTGTSDDSSSSSEWTASTGAAASLLFDFGAMEII